MLEDRVHSLMLVPLVVRGCALGLVCFYRWGSARGPFEDDDLELAVDLVGRAAVALDNGRRYIRERNTVLALQQGMLPQRFAAPRAVDWAHHMVYSGAGGDWTDVIPLPGARVALVTGSTPGRGVRTAATMGRLRAAVHTLANLDLAPDELLARLDDLVRALGRESGETSAGTPIGASCLYLVYDPVTGHGSMASAGHPAPVLAHPDGTVTAPPPPTGEPLGHPGPPFEKVELDLPEDTLIVLHTRGLLQKFPAQTGAAELERLVASPTGSLQNLSLTLTEALVPPDPQEDAAVLVARTRPLDPGSVLLWDLPPDPAAVATARTLATRQLATWGLAEEEAFATELIVSELVTNAIRYAAPPSGSASSATGPSRAKCLTPTAPPPSYGTPAPPTRAAADCCSSLSSPNAGERGTRNGEKSSGPSCRSPDRSDRWKVRNQSLRSVCCAEPESALKGVKRAIRRARQRSPPVPAGGVPVPRRRQRGQRVNRDLRITADGVFPLSNDPTGAHPASIPNALH